MACGACARMGTNDRTAPAHSPDCKTQREVVARWESRTTKHLKRYLELQLIGAGAYRIEEPDAVMYLGQVTAQDAIHECHRRLEWWGYKNPHSIERVK